MTGRDAARLIVHRLLKCAWDTEINGGDSLPYIATATAILEVITEGDFDGKYEYTPTEWEHHHAWVDKVVAENKWSNPWDYDKGEV